MLPLWRGISRSFAHVELPLSLLLYLEARKVARGFLVSRETKHSSSISSSRKIRLGNETRVDIYENKKGICICISISFSVMNDHSRLEYVYLSNVYKFINFIICKKCQRHKLCTLSPDWFQLGGEGDGKKFNKIWTYCADNARRDAQEDIARW